MARDFQNRHTDPKRSTAAGTAASLLLLLVAACGGGTATEPEPDVEAQPANVVIVSVDEMLGANGEWHISLVLENTGGEGRFRMRFEGGNCINTHSPMTIGAGVTWTREWVSGCSAQPEDAVTLTLLDGEFMETDREPIPPPGS